MASNWTRLDPGAGDVAACETAREWANAQLTDLSEAQSTVSTVLRDLDDLWAGESADAFRARVQQLHTQLEDSTEAMEAARKAIIAYGDAVEDIARRAEPLKQDLSAAQQVLNGRHNDVLSGTDADAFQDQLKAQLQATTAASEAVDALTALAAERTNADQTLAALLARVASAAWDGLGRGVGRQNRTPRDTANARVWDLLEDFRSGTGDRGNILGPDDPFVSTLMHSDHMNSVREQVLDDIRHGDLHPGGDPVDYNRVISNNPWVLVGDSVNLGSSMMTGTIPDALLGGQNLPESFLGSYLVDVPGTHNLTVGCRSRM